MQKNRSDEPEHMETRVKVRLVTTGFHNETSESEVIQFLKETISEIGMLIENVRIERTAKPITHAFIHFKNEDDRNKYIRSCREKNYEEGH